MRRLPGDLTPARYVERAIRVDHAGEYGAKRIYAGQLAVLGHTGSGDAVRHMAAQEEAHLAWFDQALTERGIRPTLLHPFWHAAGFALGAVTALMGEKAAMACTAAVETEIDRHYGDQLRRLGDDEPALVAAITQFRAEEAEHHDTAIDLGAEQTPAYRLLSAAIRAGCRAAIRISEIV